MDLHVTELRIENHVGIVRLARPDRGNSWTNRMNAEYRWLMQSLEDNPDVRVIVVTGAGRQFCVGADFKALDHHRESDKDYVESSRHEDMARPGHGVRPEFDHELVWHWGLSKPVIAAVNGACAGIALALTAFCDLRYAAAGAKFTSSTPRLGLPSEYGLSWVLPRIVGLTRAAEVLLTGRVFVAEEMLAMGFLNAVFPAEAFEARVLAVATEMAHGVSPIAVKAAKRQLYAEQLDHDPGHAVENAKALTGKFLKHPDFREGVAAAQAKRAPFFAALSDLGP
ncbi:enoyl-CoA hydratase-related protein [Variovorax sp. PBL-E5]|uniref:enoyl-CoA hydratase-related protein n=1 Tax=Variovorax sp. PBL-E5 TaxID=434014 RepID=UPI001318C74D|nr:enoyl-CoA hydratase-related protein [Variovorax sp. PBL-E5]VTU30713.1 1,2-epoxyphenylacetyl-CoA isomerase [Variovorax sp. PBL-E5]